MRWEPNKNIRKKFYFHLGMWVEIYWNWYLEKWCAEMGSPDARATVYSTDRRKLPSLLRLEIAKQINPKIKEVHDRMSKEFTYFEGMENYHGSTNTKIRRFSNTPIKTGNTLKLEKK